MSDSIENLKTRLSELRSIDFTALDYESIQAELLDYIATAQSNVGVVDDFLDGDAAKVFLDLFSYLGDILAFRIDTMSNETYLSTAQRRQSIINLLELVAQRIQNPKESQVTLLSIPVTISQTDIQIPARHSIDTIGLDGNDVTFEVMNKRIDYFTPVIIPAGVTNFNIKAFSGSYKSENFISTGEPNLQIKLTNGPVIEDTVRVSITPISSELLTPEIIESTRATEVTSLIDATNDIIYQLKFDEDGSGTLTFATEFFGKIPPNGNTIHVDYRIGGGTNTNVAAGTIEVSSTFTNLGGEFIDVTLVNEGTKAEGGEDLEDLDAAKIRVPGLVRANENLVTVDDYMSLIRRVGGVQDVFAVDRFTDQGSFGSKFGVEPNSIHIWILPNTGGEISPDLRQLVSTLLEEGRLTAITNFIFNPEYIDWELDSDVFLTEKAVANVVREDIINALTDKWGREFVSFQNEIRRSQIITTIQNVDGVEFVELNKPIADLKAEENQVLRLLDSNITLRLKRE